MNKDSLTAQRFLKMDYHTQQRVIDFAVYLVSREYNEVDRCINEEEYENCRADKRLEIKWYKKNVNKLKIKK